MRSARLLLVAATLAACLSVARLVSPGQTFACRCAPPKALAAYVDEPGSIVVAGAVGVVGPDGTAPFMVARVFFGASNVPALTVLAPHNGGICEPTIVSNERVVLVGAHENGVIRPLACAPYAAAGSPEGQQLLAEAAATFGQSIDAEATSGGGVDGPLLLAVIGAVSALTLGLFLAVVLLSRRRGRAT